MTLGTMMSRKKPDPDPVPWCGTGEHGAHPSLVSTLTARMAVHSPEVVIGIRRYLQDSGQRPESRHPYDGTDSSARLFLVLMEALLIFEQLRYEIRDQVDQAQRGHGVVPSHLLSGMSELLNLEAELVQAAKASWSVHLAVWKADVPREPSEPVDLSDAAGRWHRGDSS
jgi:hypothetical protein